VDRTTLRNIARNAVRPGYLPVMTRKAAARLRPAHQKAAVAWAAEHAEPVAVFAERLNADLWAESRSWAEKFRAEAERRIPESSRPVLGGGGPVLLLHFLTSYLRPSTVLETGVAAGFSSQAILAALEANEKGHLYSSDFPYFRLDDPEQHCGFLVDDNLRHRWTLGLRGDRENVPGFLSEIRQIDLLHYDSDKSASGRMFVMETVKDKLADDAVIVMDDIEDNSFFRDWVRSSGREFRVLGGGTHFVGVCGI